MLRRSVGVLALLCASVSTNAPAGGRPTLKAVAEAPPLRVGILVAAAKPLAERLRGGTAAPGRLVASDRAPRLVELAIGDGKTPARRAQGTGRGLWAAVEEALRRLGDRPRGERTLARLDVAVAFAREEKAVIGLWKGFVVGYHGVAFPDVRGLTLFPTDMVAAGCHSPGGRLLPRSVVRAIPATMACARVREAVAKFRPVRLRRYATVSLFTDGRTARLLCAGRRVVEPVTPARIEEALRLAAEVFPRLVKRDGAFLYGYDPVTNESLSGYSLPRHCGALWALLDLYAWRRDARLLDAARRAVRALLAYRRPFGAPEAGAAALVRLGKAKLGSAALAVAALTRYQEITGDRQYGPLARGLGRFLLLSQERNGRFVCRYAYPSAKADRKWRSVYYPGEAVFALTRLHALTQEEKWLLAAGRGAYYIIKVRDADTPPAKLYHDHWLLLGLETLCLEDPSSRLWLDHLSKLSGAIMASQNRRVSEPWALGGFEGRTQVTPAATRTEGLIAAWRALKRAGRKAEAQRTYNALGLSLAFQVRMQGRLSSTFLFHRPEFLVGQFPAGVGLPFTRVDFLQHNVSGLIGMLRLMQSERRTEAPTQATPEARLLRLAAQRAMGER